jgi:hypothetical protein
MLPAMRPRQRGLGDFILGHKSNATAKGACTAINARLSSSYPPERQCRGLLPLESNDQTWHQARFPFSPLFQQQLPWGKYPPPLPVPCDVAHEGATPTFFQDSVPSPRTLYLLPMPRIFSQGSVPLPRALYLLPRPRAFSQGPVPFPRFPYLLPGSRTFSRNPVPSPRTPYFPRTPYLLPGQVKSS